MAKPRQTTRPGPAPPPSDFCGYCKEPVWPSQPSVWLTLAPGGKGKPGRVHVTCQREAWARTQRLVKAAMADGTHSPKWSGRHCDLCGKPVTGYAGKTQEGKMAGPCCWVEMPKLTEDDLNRMRHPDDGGERPPRTGNPPRPSRPGSPGRPNGGP